MDEIYGYEEMQADLGSLGWYLFLRENGLEISAEQQISFNGATDRLNAFEKVLQASDDSIWKYWHPEEYGLSQKQTPFGFGSQREQTVQLKVENPGFVAQNSGPSDLTAVNDDSLIDWQLIRLNPEQWAVKYEKSLLYYDLQHSGQPDSSKRANLYWYISTNGSTMSDIDFGNLLYSIYGDSALVYNEGKGTPHIPFFRNDWYCSLAPHHQSRVELEVSGVKVNWNITTQIQGSGDSGFHWDMDSEIRADRPWWKKVIDYARDNPLLKIVPDNNKDYARAKLAPMNSELAVGTIFLGTYYSGSSLVRVGKAVPTAVKVAQEGLVAERVSSNAAKMIDGINIVDGKVGGKIPVEDFKMIRSQSVHNANKDSMTLGKYTSVVENGVEKVGPDSYISKAGNNSTYFDLGNEWSPIQKRYNLTDREMFEYFNIPALDDAIKSDKIIRFSHRPDLEIYKGSYLRREWDYLQKKGYSTLIEGEGGFWYAKK